MGPDELGNLLGRRGAGSRKQSALALYEGTREDDLVNEDIDERILRILGLDDVFDIDYGTYLTLLREKLVESRMVDKKLSTEENMLLTDEFKRVKGNVGRFRIRKKKITSENIGVTGPIRVSTEKFYLTSKAIIPQSALPEGESSEDIRSIAKALDAIQKSLTDQNKLTKKKAEEDRKSDEQGRRVKREAELEKPIQKAASIIKKIVAPFQSILDRIMRFIQFTLLGYFVDKVLKWFADPANERKIKVLARFLKDWWPALLAAYGLFATPFGKFVRSTLKLLRGFIPQMVRFIAANPLVFAGAATAAATGAAELWRQKEEKKQIENEAAKREVKPEVIRSELEASRRSPIGMIGEAFQKIGPLGYSSGGKIKKMPLSNISQIDAKNIAFAGGAQIDHDSGLRITGAGPDTQLVAAQPGEIVMSKKAVDKYGANFFLGLNKRAGGTNIPKMVNNIQLATGGGMIGGFGRVMAPRTGGKTQWANQGSRSVFQMFGMNIPGTERPATYSSSDVNRYNKLNKKRSIQTGSSYTQIPSGGFGIAPTIRTIMKNPNSQNGSFIGDSFRNFSSNVEKIRGSAIRQEKIMREMGVEPSGYVNLRGQPINLGPQSRSILPGTPVIRNKTQVVVLPPTTTTIEKPKVPTISGTQIPQFSIVANTGHRSIISDSLGISDLVGA